MCVLTPIPGAAGGDGADGDINIVRVNGRDPSTPREAEFAAKLASLAGFGGVAAGRIAEAAAGAADAVGGAADAAAAAGHAMLERTSAVFHCVSSQPFPATFLLVCCIGRDACLRRQWSASTLTTVQHWTVAFKARTARKHW